MNYLYFLHVVDIVLKVQLGAVNKSIDFKPI
jgi:hypothetical protein